MPGLAWWTAALAAAGAALVLTAAVLAGPVGGAVAVAALTAGAALLGVRAGRVLAELPEDAVRRLTPTAAADAGAGSRPGLRLRVAEVARLAAGVDALALRVRVGDELAERRRRTAQTASAGVGELLSGLVAAEEGARGQLAAELHDTVAQSLMLARGLLDSGAPDAVARAADFVADAEDQVRGVMARTRPPALRDGDLAHAVRGLCDDLERRYGLAVDLRWPAQPHPLPLVAATTAYRFLQEALLNVVKHADVDVAEAALVVTPRELVAVVQDAGPGFDPSAVRSARGRHVGLGLLRERARIAGGSLTLTSPATGGTCLELRLPLPEAPADLAPRSA